MRISDWSSDVCSSDLLADGVERAARDRALRHRQVDAQRLEPLRQLDQIGQFAIGARQIGLRQLMFDGAHADDAFAACGAGGHAEYPSIRDWRELWKSTCAPAERTEERRVGKAGVRMCRAGGAPYN